MSRLYSDDKDIDKLVRVLIRQYGFKLVSNNKHAKLEAPNGRRFTVSRSPRVLSLAMVLREARKLSGLDIKLKELKHEPGHKGSA